MQRPQIRAWIAGFFSVVALLSACSCRAIMTASPSSGAKGKKNTASERKTDPFREQFKMRAKLQDEYFSAMDRLVDRPDLANNKEVHVIRDFLKANAIIQIRIGSNVGSYQAVKVDHPINMFIVLDEDLKNIPALRALVARLHSIGYFLPSHPIPALLIIHSQWSSLGKAQIILHEGDHALDFYARPANAPPLTKLDKALGEVHAYEMEFRLLETIGGKKYRDLLDGEVARIEKNDLGTTQDQQDALVVEQCKALDEIFGPVQSDESANRWDMFSMAAMFKTLDRAFGADLAQSANRVKADLYLRMMGEKPIVDE